MKSGTTCVCVCVFVIVFISAGQSSWVRSEFALRNHLGDRLLENRRSEQFSTAPKLFIALQRCAPNSKRCRLLLLTHQPRRRLTSMDISSLQWITSRRSVSRRRSLLSKARRENTIALQLKYESVERSLFACRKATNTFDLKMLRTLQLVEQTVVLAKLPRKHIILQTSFEFGHDSLLGSKRSCLTLISTFQRPVLAIYPG